MTGIVLLTIRRWSPPFGSFTLIFTVSTLLTVAVHENWQLAPAAILAGLIADGLLHWLRPTADRPLAFQWFAFAVPTIFFGLLFATLALSDGIWWTVHLWVVSL